MTKGDDTRRAVLRQAVELTSQVGLEGLTVGVLAKRVGLSKSGLYAHFESKEDLQGQVLDAAAEHYVNFVIRPAIDEPRGLPRLRRLFELWIRWGTDVFDGGCPFVAAVADFDDRPGSPVRDRLVYHLKNLLASVARAAQISVTEGHLRADLDADQFAYEFWAIGLAYQHYSRLLTDPEAVDRARRAFDALVRRSQPPELP